MRRGYVVAHTSPLRLANLGSHQLTRLEHTLLRNQVIGILRDRIISGSIPSGAPLVERDLAQQLGISRIPVRDALILLEQEGLVTSTSAGRSVIKLTESDVHGLYDVRIALERLAAHLAAQNRQSHNGDALQASMQFMRDAIDRKDAAAYQRSDMDMHRLVWEQSGNIHLVKALSMMVGPIFMLISRHAAFYDWRETLRLHEEMVNLISAGDAPAAEESVARHLENARRRSIGLLEKHLL